MYCYCQNLPGIYFITASVVNEMVKIKSLTSLCLNSAFKTLKLQFLIITIVINISEQCTCIVLLIIIIIYAKKKLIFIQHKNNII